MRTFIVLSFIICIIYFATAFSFKPVPTQKISKAALGKMLFFDTILSSDYAVSCASCHKPEFAFADTTAFSRGVQGKLTDRNTPSVLNMKNRPYFFWDGRAPSLSAQALIPIENPNEMNLPIDSAINRLLNSRIYTQLFKQVFHQKPNAKNLGLALAAYEQTLETVDTKFDDWASGNAKLTAQEENGRQLFLNKARCFSCHSMEDFTDDEYRNIGLFNGKELNDSGRSKITANMADVGKFKTPGLRNIAVTAPYMHNGMFKTLAEVLEYYNNANGFFTHQNQVDSILQSPLHLTKQEQQDIIAFLNTLTDYKYAKKN